MYGFGWRKRIGVISPSVMELIPYDFYRFAPEGIGLVGLTSGTDSWSDEDIEKSLQDAITCSVALGARKVDFIVHMGAAHVTSRGLGYDQTLLKEMVTRSGVPATTSIRSAMDAMNHLGLKKIAIASPWPVNITTWASDYLIGNNFSVVAKECLGAGFVDLHKLGPGELYRFVTAVARACPECDGVYVPGPQAPVAEVVDAIEREIRKPVIASIPADFWAAFHALGVSDRIEGHGRLLASLSK